MTGPRRGTITNGSGSRNYLLIETGTQISYLSSGLYLLADSLDVDAEAFIIEGLCAALAKLEALQGAAWKACHAERQS